jgi:hypothetical protein
MESRLARSKTYPIKVCALCADGELVEAIVFAICPAT